MFLPGRFLSPVNNWVTRHSSAAFAPVNIRMLYDHLVITHELTFLLCSTPQYFVKHACSDTFEISSHLDSEDHSEDGYYRTPNHVVYLTNDKGM